MSQFIKFYFTYSMLNMLKPATRIPPQPTTPKLQHTSKQEHNQCGDTIEKSQAGCINVRNMLSIEEVK